MPARRPQYELRNPADCESQRIAFGSLAEAERFGWEVLEELVREGAVPTTMEVVDESGAVVRVLRHRNWH